MHETALGALADVLSSNNALRAERDAYLAAAIAAVDATLDATDLSEDPSSRSNGQLLAAVRQMADLQGQCLIAQDRFINCCADIPLDHETIAALRQSRAELASRLQHTLAELEGLTSDPEERPSR